MILGQNFVTYKQNFKKGKYLHSPVNPGSLHIAVYTEGKNIVKNGWHILHLCNRTYLKCHQAQLNASVKASTGTESDRSDFISTVVDLVQANPYE